MLIVSLDDLEPNERELLQNHDRIVVNAIVGCALYTVEDKIFLENECPSLEMFSGEFPDYYVRNSWLEQDILETYWDYIVDRLSKSECNKLGDLYSRYADQTYEGSNKEMYECVAEMLKGLQTNELSENKVRNTILSGVRKYLKTMRRRKKE